MNGDLKLGKDIEDLEKRIIENAERIERITAQIEYNAGKIESNANDIDNNSRKIENNTGAIDVLHTIKTYNFRFFLMWLITFIALTGLAIYTIRYKDSVNTITTQEVDQESNDGSNYYVGRDGDINE